MWCEYCVLEISLSGTYLFSLNREGVWNTISSLSLSHINMKEYNALLITAAQESSENFVHFLLGYMSNLHHKEMAEIAEHWLLTRYPEKLAEFKSNNIKEEDDGDETEIQES